MYIVRDVYNCKSMKNSELLKRFMSYLEKAEKLVVFSPHFDDAVLSMGELMFNQHTKGKKIQVYNIFTQASDSHSALTEKLLKQAGYDNPHEYFAKRKKEDMDAFSAFANISIHSLDFVDGVWRKDQNGKPLYPLTTWNINVHTKEKGLIEQIKKSLRAINLDTQDFIVFAPVGRGKEHVDHIIVRDICLNLFPRIIFYSDFSYSESFPLENEFIRKNKLIPITLTDRSFNQHKIEAIAKHKSQSYALFKDSKNPQLPPETFYVQEKLMEKAHKK